MTSTTQTPINLRLPPRARKALRRMIRDQEARQAAANRPPVRFRWLAAIGMHPNPFRRIREALTGFRRASA